MESARLSIKEGTPHAAYISISIILFTKRGVKKKKYQSIIGPFHGTFGKKWRKKKRLR
jgi:hypothetical protein